jgi:hypothetical protein
MFFKLIQDESYPSMVVIVKGLRVTLAPLALSASKFPAAMGAGGLMSADSLALIRL